MGSSGTCMAEELVEVVAVEVTQLCFSAVKSLLAEDVLLG